MWKSNLRRVRRGHPTHWLISTQVIRTATGPGGVSGPLRVDLKGNFHPSPLQEYSEHEARSAFTRMLQHHRTNGW